jgi:hypothetical protein
MERSEVVVRDQQTARQRRRSTGHDSGLDRQHAAEQFRREAGGYRPHRDGGRTVAGPR